MIYINYNYIYKTGIILATHNQNKIIEYKEILKDLGLNIDILNDFYIIPSVCESGCSFNENAKLKADIISKNLHLPVIADDSGLLVDALNGKPGIFSARFAGDHDEAANNDKLLSEMQGIPFNNRQAIFHTSIVFADYWNNKKDIFASGNLRGFILDKPRGSNSFGYDPLFYIPTLGKTLAEMTISEKNRLSHRRRAFINLMKNLFIENVD